jgi:hypothetical protein
VQTAADIRRHADEAIVKAVDFVADPLDAEQRRMKQSELSCLPELAHSKVPFGAWTRRAEAIARATGVWVR